MTYSYQGRRSNSVLDAFSLNPLPYPVLLFLAVIFIFLGSSWYFSYEEAVESAEEQFNWLLLATPVLLILLVRWLSSIESLDGYFPGMSPWDRCQKTHYGPSEGSSPWGVAAVIVLLLVLVQFHSMFRDSWGA